MNFKVFIGVAIVCMLFISGCSNDTSTDIPDTDVDTPTIGLDTDVAPANKDNPFDPSTLDFSAIMNISDQVNASDRIVHAFRISNGGFLMFNLTSTQPLFSCFSNLRDVSGNSTDIQCVAGAVSSQKEDFIIVVPDGDYAYSLINSENETAYYDLSVKTAKLVGME